MDLKRLTAVERVDPNTGSVLFYTISNGRKKVVVDPNDGELIYKGPPLLMQKTVVKEPDKYVDASMLPDIVKEAIKKHLENIYNA